MFRYIFLLIFLLIMQEAFSQSSVPVKADSITTNNPLKDEITFLKGIDSPFYTSPAWSPLHLPVVDSSEKLVTVTDLELNVTNDLKIPERLFLSGANGFVIGGGANKNRIEHFGDIDFLSGGNLTYTTLTRAKSVVGSNNYDVENLAKYPNFLEGSTDQYTCLACTPSIVVGGGVMAGTNSLKITHTTTSQLTFEAPTSGELGQYVTLNISVKTDTITHIVPVTDTVGDVTNEWILSPSNNYQTVTITYPMGATSTGFFVIPQDGGETEISQVHLKRANDKSKNVVLYTDPVPCQFSSPLNWGGFGTVTDVDLLCARKGTALYISGSFTTGTVTTAAPIVPFPINWGSLTSAQASMNAPLGIYGPFAATLNKGGYLFSLSGHSAFSFSQNSTISGTTINPMSTPGNGTTVATTGENIRFSATVEIAEWQTGASVTQVDCAFADKRKCAEGNTIKFAYNATSNTVTDQFGNTYPFSKTGTSNTNKVINLTSLGLSNPMSCTQGNIISSGATTHSSFTDVTPTSIILATTTNANAGGDFSTYFDCSKRGSDIYYGPNYVASCENTISANEVMCGRDEINNKPIYKRCFEITSNITAPTNIATWQTNLKFVNSIKYLGDLWDVGARAASGTTETGLFMQYNQSTGVISVTPQGSWSFFAGTNKCLEYTKP